MQKKDEFTISHILEDKFRREARERLRAIKKASVDASNYTIKLKEILDEVNFEINDFLKGIERIRLEKRKEYLRLLFDKLIDILPWEDVDIQLVNSEIEKKKMMAEKFCDDELVCEEHALASVVAELYVDCAREVVQNVESLENRLYELTQNIVSFEDANPLLTDSIKLINLSIYKKVLLETFTDEEIKEIYASIIGVHYLDSISEDFIPHAYDRISNIILEEAYIYIERGKDLYDYTVMDLLSSAIMRNHLEKIASEHLKRSTIRPAKDVVDELIQTYIDKMMQMKKDSSIIQKIFVRKQSDILKRAEKSFLKELDNETKEQRKRFKRLEKKRKP
ncbi:MAG: hypothetical protein ACE5K4_05420 [Candidatus Hydrothermarchaeota archaeon]